MRIDFVININKQAMTSCTHSVSDTLFVNKIIIIIMDIKNRSCVMLMTQIDMIII